MLTMSRTPTRYDAGPAPSPVLLHKAHKEYLALQQARTSQAGSAINEAAPPRSSPLVPRPSDILADGPRDPAVQRPPSGLSATDGHAKKRGKAVAAAAAPPPPPPPPPPPSGGLQMGGLRMEVACCDADHEGVWEGEWEECEVVADHGDTCDVRIVEDGELCFGVPRRMVRAVLEGGPRSLATGSADRPVRRRSRLGATAAAVMDALAPMAAAVMGGVC